MPTACRSTLIAKTCRMSQERVYYWVDGGPPKRAAAISSRCRAGAAALARNLRKRRLTGDRVALVTRLWRTAEAQVRDIEERLMSSAQPPDEREKDARTLAVLVKTLARADRVRRRRGASRDRG